MMTQILVQPPQLRQTAEQLRAHAQKIDQALRAIDNNIRLLKGHHFLGNRADAVQTHYAPKREALLDSKELVLLFAEELNLAANTFEKADSKDIPNSDSSSEQIDPSEENQIDIIPSWKDLKYLFAGGYLATHLKWSALRPNSIVFTGPNWMRKAVGIKEATRVIKPTTLVKQMALLAYAENVAEGIQLGIQTFNDPRYAGTDRAFPAGLVDGIVKTAILAAGTTVLVGATALITSISAPVVVVGGAVVATWVVGGFLLDKLVQTPVWNAWQNSSQRDQFIEGTTRAINTAKNYVKDQASQGVETVKNAFQGFILNLIPSPA